MGKQDHNLKPKQIKAALTVRCPSCAALPGAACMTPQGRLLAIPHGVRIVRAETLNTPDPSSEKAP